jgi:hypothetical protein
MEFIKTNNRPKYIKRKNDCVIRAISLYLGRTYFDISNTLQEFCKEEYNKNYIIGASVPKKIVDDFLDYLGLKRVYLKQKECIARTRNHLFCIKNHKRLDIHNKSQKILKFYS